MYEYDRGMAVIHMSDAQKLFRTGEGVTGLRLKLTDMFAAWTVSADLGRQMSGDLRVRDWTQQHSNFFSAIRTEKMVMFIILSMIVGVAAFNLVSTLVMVVTDKQADIAILRTLGASPGQIMRVFMVQGTLIGCAGTLLGVLFGVLLAANVETVVPLLEQAFGFKALPGDVYYINTLPSELKSSDVGRIALVALLFSALATIYPAWRASRTQPAQALRYE
jgi:lipoprotein-releasing system permease protein